MPFSWRWQFLRQLATDRREAMHASSESSLSIERRFRATLRAKVPHTNARNNWLHRRQVGRERTHIGRPSSEEPRSENLWQGLFGMRIQRVVQSISRERSIRAMTTAPSVTIPQ